VGPRRLQGAGGHRLASTTRLQGPKARHAAPSGARGRAPEPFEVDLTGRRRLVIVVDDGGDGVAGDELALAQPRFTRARP
jgi:hypothetical protein